MAGRPPKKRNAGRGISKQGEAGGNRKMTGDSAPAAADPGDLDPDRLGFVRAAVAGAACRGGTKMVEPDRQPHMRIGRTDVVHGVEADPAEVAHERLGPGVAGRLFRVLGTIEVAGDVAGGDIDMTGGGAEDMGEVLADAVPAGEGLDRAGTGIGRVHIEAEVL